jgi:probable phosphoglycerate mutase
VTRILLLRHGQSEWNALGKWQGQADPPLTNLGRQQAHHAADHLATNGADFASAVSSDLSRASETASIIATRLGVPLSHERGLRERHVGSWQGLTRDEIEARWPGWLEVRRRPDDFETDDEVLTRTRRAIELIGRVANDGAALVVCHGGIIFSIERSVGAPHEPLPNLAGRWLTVHDGGEWELGERVALVDAGETTVPRQL